MYLLDLIISKVCMKDYLIERRFIIGLDFWRLEVLDGKSIFQRRQYSFKVIFLVKYIFLDEVFQNRKFRKMIVRGIEGWVWRVEFYQGLIEWFFFRDEEGEVFYRINFWFQLLVFEEGFFFLFFEIVVFVCLFGILRN